MLPELFKLGPFTLHSFGLMMALSFLVAVLMAAPEFTRRGMDSEQANETGLGAMIGGVSGAKLYYILDHLKDFQADPRGMIFSGAGLTWYGGLIGGALGALLVAHWRKIPLLTLCDIAAPILPLSYAVGRVGCFLNGDDYGRVSNVPWAMAFPKGAPPTLERVHPTQVYEVIAGVLMWAFLNSLKVRLQARVGALFGLYLVLAGIERFIVEYFRTNPPQAWGITMAQTISLGLIVLGGWIYSRARNARVNMGAAAPQASA